MLPCSFSGWDVTLELAGFVENVVYKVTSAGSSFVLRLHRPGYHTLAELEAEQAWTAALNEAGLAAPQPVATCAGERYVLVDVPGSSPRYAGLSVWRPGQTMDALINHEVNPILLATVRKLGGLAAALHNQAVNWEPPTSFERRTRCRRTRGRKSVVGSLLGGARAIRQRACTSEDLRDSLPRVCLAIHNKLQPYSLRSASGNVLLHKGRHDHRL